MGSYTNPELNYFICTLGQAAERDGFKSHAPKTITDFIDRQAERSPALPAVGFPIVDAEAWSAEIFTYEHLCNCSKTIAGSLAEAFADLAETKDAKCVALLCPSSVDFLFTWLALMRLGCSVLLIAPQCQPAAIAHLCLSCDTSLLLFDQTYQDLARASSDAPTANHTSAGLPWQSQSNGILPLLRESAAIITNLKSPERNETDVAYIFHTSGTSTGLPKPIPQTHHAGVGVLPCLDGKEAATFTTTPLYHGGIADCFRAWTSNSLIWLFPGADAPITSKNILRCLSVAADFSERDRGIPTVKYFSSVPYILQMLSEDDDSLLWLQKMDIVGVGGAALPPVVGDQIVSKGVNLVSRFGSAECGFLLSSHRDFDLDKEWQFLRVPHDAKFLKFEEQNDGAGLSQLVVLKGWPHMAKRNRSDDSFATSDLFEPHPSISKAWRYHSRSDSQITLVTGKKFDPALVEEAIMSSSTLIRDAMVFGNGRQFPGALIFPSEQGNMLSKGELKQEIWKEIDKLNSKGQAHTRISENMIVLMELDTEPLAKSSKGTLLRGLAEQKFQKDIENAYEDEEGAGNPGNKLQNGEVLSFVRNAVHQVVGKQLDDDEDFYHSGVDSTKVTQIRSLLQRRVGLPNMNLPWNVVYDGGDIIRLAHLLISIHSGQSAEPRNEAAYIYGLYQNYSRRIQVKSSRASSDIRRNEDSPSKQTIILTGATGALGAHILDLLRVDTRVSQIVCLVRARNMEEARKRVSESLLKRWKQRLATEDDRILCLPATLGKENLGLKNRMLSQMYENTTTIIHAAWTVNFSLPLKSFVQDHIAGLANLLAFSINCMRSVRFIFCSSTASVIGQPQPILESISKDPRHSDSLGYSKSKWVAEAICDDFHQRSINEASSSRTSHQKRDSTVVLRIGQLTGDTENGVWNMTEAWPLMLSTVKDLRCLPDLNETLSWLPVNIAAKAVIQIANAEEKPTVEDDQAGCPVYHLVNNSTSTTWKDLLRWLKAIENSRFDIVEPTEWLDKLEKLESHPAKALLGLWKHAYGMEAAKNGHQIKRSELGSLGILFSTEKTRAIAEVMRDLGPMDEGLVRKIWAWLESELRAGGA